MTDTPVLGAAELPGATGLPELAAVPWRPLADERHLRRRDHAWTRWTVYHQLPFWAVAVGLPLLSPVLIGMSVIALLFAWFIPELYARRGAGVLRDPLPARTPVGGADSRRGSLSALTPPRPGGAGGHPHPAAEQRALGLLGDLVGHAARVTLSETGFAVEPGRLGTWIVGPAGALLVRPGGRRIECWCVRATGDTLPRADRIAHLLLALRTDESGFATVANLSFSGARWRVRHVLGDDARAALGVAVTTGRR